MADAPPPVSPTASHHLVDPARLRIRAMCSEMPRHCWNKLPGAALIPERVRGMVEGSVP
jgi:hypothetical protein